MKERYTTEPKGPITSPDHSLRRIDTEPPRMDIDGYPELTLAKMILEKGYSRRGEVKDVPEHDIEKIVELIRSESPRFQAHLEQFREYEVATELPDDETMRAKIEKTFKLVEEAVKELNFLPKNFDYKRKNEPPLELRYDRDLSYGQFAHHSLFEHLPENIKANVIVIGGRLVQQWASMLRQEAGNLGVQIDVENSIDLILTHAIAHEYTHYLEALYQPKDLRKYDPFFERSEKITNDGLELDDKTDRWVVFEERFAQSVGREVVKRRLEKMEIEPSAIQALQNRASGRIPEKLTAYRGLVDWAKTNGYKTSDVERMLRDARLEMQKAGYEDDAERFVSSWRWAGYHLPEYDLEQIRYIGGAK